MLPCYRIHACSRASKKRCLLFLFRQLWIMCASPFAVVAVDSPCPRRLKVFPWSRWYPVLYKNKKFVEGFDPAFPVLCGIWCPPVYWLASIVILAGYSFLALLMKRYRRTWGVLMVCMSSCTSCASVWCVIQALFNVKYQAIHLCMARI